MDAHEPTITDGRFVTEELATWISEVQYEDLPDDVVEEAGRAFVDYLGECLFVGAQKPWGQAIAAFCASQGGCQPEATIIATGEKTLASRAAMANGTMALGFEYADFFVAGRPYPFAVTAPLAVAEWREKSGKDLVLGIVLGYEIMGRVGRAMMQEGKSTGFYVPALYGTFGGAAGAARILGLSPKYTNYALGLAAAFTGGTFQGHEEGAWQRSLNGGMSGERAVTAAQMAETGFRATELGLEGIQGFAAMYTDNHLDQSLLLDDLGDSWLISTRWVKPFPMNLTLHAPVTALINIMQEHDLRHDDIEEIDAAWQKVEPFLGKSKVSTVVAAQASLPFALSVAAVRGVDRGKVTVDDFTDETVADPVIQGMIPRTKVHQDTELYEQALDSKPASVTVRTKDGREFNNVVMYPKGNPKNKLTEDEFKGKFMEMAERVLGQPQAEELYAQARGIERVDNVADITPLFSPK